MASEALQIIEMLETLEKEDYDMAVSYIQFLSDKRKKEQQSRREMDKGQSTGGNDKECGFEKGKKFYYRVNPTCPNCKEEHIGWDITVSEEEQKIMDEYYEKCRGLSDLALLLEKPPLYVKRNFKCPICKAEFDTTVGIYKQNAI